MAGTALNTNFQAAKKAKGNEFYTQLTDTDKELRNNRQHFQDKVLYCNCHDPRVSNFFHYFLCNFQLNQMEADHITPWRDSGKTILENCQMFCRDCNRRESAK
ncbi:HNH endonuclease signature motif containing protein [Nesterenkonia ebinurensis]|uniref:HNH endonuclease signature motif containing protein n=1 Tax=Nesterenkonia ebinurensis TaxID=2608252 RepID=UPI00123DE810